MFTDMRYTFPGMIGVQDESQYTFMDNFIDNTGALIILMANGMAAEKGISTEGKVFINTMVDESTQNEDRTVHFLSIDDTDLLRIEYTISDVNIFFNEQGKECQISLMNPQVP